MSDEAGIREVIVQVADVDAAVRFYEHVCGFTHLRTVGSGDVEVAEMAAGGQRVVLVPAADPGVTLALVDRADAARRLDDAGVAAERIEGADGTWLAFSDPWGNRLGFFDPR